MVFSYVVWYRESVKEEYRTKDTDVVDGYMFCSNLPVSATYVAIMFLRSEEHWRWRWP